MTQQGSSVPLVSIIIKALNEERHIAACLDAVMTAINGQPWQAEVLLVDSLSTDRTVEIASRYPIRIVQFMQREDRGCGAAVQLGFQECKGDFIYVLDADMRLAPDFLALALHTLRTDLGLAAVGGKLVDDEVRTRSDARRALHAHAQRNDVEVPELGGGGLYRREAVEHVGYLANRWLAAYEEADLGARLRSAGWRLVRLQAVAVHHEGHPESDWAMLQRLWRNGRATAGGAFLRAAWRKPWWRLAARKQRYVLFTAALWGLAICSALILNLCFQVSWLAFSAVAAAPVLVYLLQLWSKQSISDANWAWLVWHVFTLAAIRGLFQTPRDPRIPIAASELFDSKRRVEAVGSLR